MRNQGVSLLELMIVVGVVGVLGLVVAELMQFTLKASKQAELEQTLSETAELMRSTVVSETACQANLSHLNQNTFSFAAADLPTVVLNFSQLDNPPPSSVPLVTAGAAVMPGLVIESIELKDFVEIQAGARYFAKLGLVARMDLFGFSKKTVVGRIPLLLTTTSVGTTATITSCGSGSVTSVSSYEWVSASAADQPGGYGNPSVTTGAQACAAKGKTCAQVVSINFIDHTMAPWFDVGQWCARTYNYGGGVPGLGVASPVNYGVVPHQPVHDCSTKIGTFTTAELTVLIPVANCGATFIAVCQ